MSFFSFLFKKKFPSAETRTALFDGALTFSKAVFYLLAAGLLIAVYALLIRLNDTLLVTVPARGGTITEGVIGAPRFLNPVLAATDTDTALSRLVFAGLMKEYGDGTIEPELASTYVLSPDGRTYTFTLREKLLFHDGSPLTSSDVAFTIEKLQNPVLNPAGSPYWQDVTVSTPNQSTVIITLLSPDQSFLQHATVGILSSAHWQGISDDAFTNPALNLKPVGAGAFAYDSASTNSAGTPTRMVFSRNKHYPLGVPYLSSLAVNVYDNQEALIAALKNGSIDMTMDLIPQSIPEGTFSDDISVAIVPERNSVALYRRSGESSLANASLLAELNRSIDKQSIVATVENGYGIPFASSEATSGETAVRPLDASIAAFEKIGFAVKDGVLSTKAGSDVMLGVATQSNPRLLAVGRALAQQFATFGIISELQSFDPGTFQDELAASAFALVLLDSDERVPSAYERAIPLYTTARLTAVAGAAHGVPQGTLVSPDLRYANVSGWHARTDRIWKLPTRK